MVETATDNNNRTVADVRSYFSKCDGNLGTSGSVVFMFEHTCNFKIDTNDLDPEEIELEFIDFGVEEVFIEEDEILIYAPFECFGVIQLELEKRDITINSSGFDRIPNVTKELKKENEINDIEKLLEKIENDDDVQNVYHNMKSHMYTKAFKHLKKDPKINNILEKYHDKISLDSYRSTNYALSLSNLIIDQQISFKAAMTIKKRFALIIQKLSHREILDLDNDKIQSIGISFRKVEYIKNVFSFFIENEKRFIDLDAEKMKEELISIKGIGKWTIEMFLMFELGKPDIFSKGDIALINSVKKNYKMNDLVD